MSQRKTTIAGPAPWLLFALAIAIAGVAGGGRSVRAAAAGTAVTIYVANEGSNSIAIYAPGSSGNADPSGTITGAHTQLSFPVGVCVDPSGDIYAVNVLATSGPSITEYSSAPSGQTAPLTMISGSNAMLSVPFGVALDPALNVYVTNSGNNTVTEYLAGANNNIAPTNIIGGTMTKLGQPNGIAIDQSGNIYVTNAQLSSVAEFAPDSSGNVAPSALISGDQTGLDNPVGIALDSAGNIYVSNASNTGGADSITEYKAGSNGNVAPIATISGEQTDLSQPNGVAVDQFGNIYAVNSSSNTITEYAAGSNGNAAPTVTLSGAALSKPAGIAVAPHAGGTSGATPTPTPTPAGSSTPTGGPTPIGLSVSTDSITFPVTGTDTKSAPVPVLIGNSGTATLQVSVDASMLLDAFTVKNAGSFKLAHNHTRTVTIQFTPSQPGTVGGNLNVTANNSSPQLSVTVTGTAQSGTLSAPAALPFGTIPVHSSLTETFAIQNTGLGVLHGKVVATGFAKGFQLLSGGGAFKLSDGATRQVKVKFTPTSSISFTGTITITSDDVTNQSQIVAVSGTGT